MKMMNAAPTTTLPLQLIGTGIALGFIHVLTGPDHLSVNKVITVTMESFRLISSRSAFRIFIILT